MSLPILYAATVVIFLGLDFLGLRYLVAPLFRRDIAHLMLESPRLGAALVFYLFYVAGLMWFVSWPALQGGTPVLRVFMVGAFFGAVAYGTYEFTNIATLKDWTWAMVATDLAWGTVLTGTAAAAGVAITRVLG